MIELTRADSSTNCLLRCSLRMRDVRKVNRFHRSSWLNAATSQQQPFLDGWHYCFMCCRLEITAVSVSSGVHAEWRKEHRWQREAQSRECCMVFVRSPLTPNICIHIIYLNLSQMTIYGEGDLGREGCRGGMTDDTLFPASWLTIAAEWGREAVTQGEGNNLQHWGFFKREKWYPKSKVKT